MRTLVLLLLLSASWLGGCVSTGRYDGLKKQYDTAQSELGRTRAEGERLRGEASQRASTISSMQAEIRKAQRQRAELEAEVAAIASDNDVLL